jgi:hypothetical protein
VEAIVTALPYYGAKIPRMLWAAFPLGAQSASIVPDFGALWGADWSAKKLDRVMTLYAPDAIF